MKNTKKTKKQNEEEKETLEAIRKSKNYLLVTDATAHKDIWIKTNIENYGVVKLLGMLEIAKAKILGDVE